MKHLIQNTINQLKDLQTGRLWIGSNFDRKIGSISAKEAFQVPHENLHSIAEILSHLTVWRTEAIQKIVTGKGTLLDSDPQNWLPNESLIKVGWNQIKLNYHDSLTQLITLLEDKEDGFLAKEYYDPDFSGDFPYSFVLDGMIHHDLYHLGQIGIILKFINAQNS